MKQSHINVPVTTELFINLVDFLREQKRTSPCFVPLVIRGFYDTGDVQLCPCEDIQNVGKIDSEYNELGNRRLIEKKLENEGFMCGKCRDCFTHYDALNQALKSTIPIMHIQSMAEWDGIENKVYRFFSSKTNYLESKRLIPNIGE